MSILNEIHNYSQEILEKEGWKRTGNAGNPYFMTHLDYPGSEIHLPTWEKPTLDFHMLTSFGESKSSLPINLGKDLYKTTVLEALRQFKSYEKMTQLIWEDSVTLYVGGEAPEGAIRIWASELQNTKTYVHAIANCFATSGKEEAIFYTSQEEVVKVFKGCGFKVINNEKAN